MTIKQLHAALLSSSLIALSVGGIAFSQQATAGAAPAQTGTPRPQSAMDSPVELVQAFVDTMAYQYLSDEDKAIWDEQTWNQMQERSLRANQPRLPQGHEFYQLESFVREFVRIEAIAYENSEDGSIRVTARTEYPNLLILIDDYADTQSSAAYEQLASYQSQFAAGELNAESISIYESEMPWRVHASGVYVNAEKMQQNRESRQAQNGW